MKTKALILVLLVAVCFSCKKEKKLPIETGPLPTTDTNYVDIVPTNKGRFLNLSKNGLRIVIWNPNNDSIFVYNTFDGSHQSTMVHPSSLGVPFNNVRLSDDGTKVVSQRNGYIIKLWDATTGGYIMDLETVFDWVIMPDGSSILGFEDNLSTRTVLKRISFVTGTMIDTDTIPESIYPYIAGTDEAGDKYLVVRYLYDLNDPFNPTKRARLIFRDLNSHTQIANYETTDYTYLGSIKLTNNADFFVGVTYDSLLLRNNIEFYETITGNWYSEEPYNSNYDAAYFMISPGPGSDRFTSVSQNFLSLDHIIFTPGTTTLSSKYSVADVTHYGFSNVDVNKESTRVAASYEASDGKVHVIVWPAW